MESGGFGKVRNNSSKQSSKPYARPEESRRKSFLNKVTDSVRGLLTPSWLTSYVTGPAQEGTSNSASGDTEAVNQQSSTLSPPQVTPSIGSSGQYHGGTNTNFVQNEQFQLNVESMRYTQTRTPDNVAQPISQPHLPLQSAYGMADSPYSRQVQQSYQQPQRQSMPVYNRQHHVPAQQMQSAENFSNHASPQIATTSHQKSSSFVQATTKLQPNTSLNQTAGQSKDNTSFNTSSFAASFNASLNESSLVDKSFGDSSFYRGKTVYGGMASRSARNIAASPYRRSVDANRTGPPKTKTTVSSKAARAILNAINKTGTTPGGVISSTDKCSYSAGIYLRRKEAAANKPPTTKLQQKAAVKITQAGQSVLLKESPLKSAIAARVPVSAQSSTFGGGKQKREKGTHYSSKPTDDDIVEVPNLSTRYTLPMAGFVPININLTTAKASSATVISDTDTYNFSPPVSLPESPTVEGNPAHADKEFDFSDPCDAKSLEKIKLFSQDITSPKKSISGNMVKSSASTGIPITTSLQSKSSSGWGDMFKDQANKWTCDTCMIQNDAGKDKCVACATAKPGAAAKISTYTSSEVLVTAATAVTASTTSGWGDLFKGQASKWTCDTCMLQNDADKAKCVACSTDKPGAANKVSPTTSFAAKPATTATTSGWGNMFKDQALKWACDTCMIQNDQDKTKCVACGTTNPAASKSSPSIVPTTSTVQATTSGWGDMFKSQANKWTCDTCMIQNDAEKAKCVACSTDKPDAANKVSPTTSSAAKPATTATTTSGWGDMFKDQSRKWTCDTCMIQNDQDKTKCVACGTTNPATSKSSPSIVPATSTVQATTSGWGDMFKSQANKWTCDTCMIQNDADKTKCVACSTDKPGAAKMTSATPAAPKVTATSGWGDLLKGQAKKWTCDSCIVLNDEDKSKCVACGTAKPGASTDPKGIKAAGWNAIATPSGMWGSSSIWTCTRCMVSNPVTLSMCKSCNAFKPGTQSSLGDVSKGRQLPLFGLDSKDEEISDSTESNDSDGKSASTTSDPIKLGAVTTPTMPISSSGSDGKQTSSVMKPFNFGTFGSSSTTATSGSDAKQASSSMKPFDFATFGASTVNSSSTTATSGSDAKQASSSVKPFNFAAFGSSAVSLASNESDTKQTSSSMKPIEFAAFATTTSGSTLTPAVQFGQFPSSYADSTTKANASSDSVASTSAITAPATTPASAFPMKFGNFSAQPSGDKSSSKDASNAAAALFSGKNETGTEPINPGSSQPSGGFLSGSASQLPSTSTASIRPATSTIEPPATKSTIPSFGSTAFGQPSSALFGSSTSSVPAATTVAQGESAASTIFGAAAAAAKPSTAIFGASGTSSTAASFFGAQDATAGVKRAGAPFDTSKTAKIVAGATTVTQGESVPSTASTLFGATANVFGAAASQAPSTGGFNFGASAVTSAGAIFGNTSTQAAPSVGYQFGAQPATSQPFNFGSNTSAASSSGGLFQFGAAQSPAPAATAAPSNAGLFGMPASASPAFGGSTTSTPVFGNSASTTPVFGTSSAAPPPSIGGFAVGNAGTTNRITKKATRKIKK